jgi:hypothetical protein
MQRHELSYGWGIIGGIGLKLNSDELGKKGEARFSEICNDAKLEIQAPASAPKT